MSVASPLSVEPPWVVHELAAQWFLPATTVAERLADLHRVVDGWVTAGAFVLAPPLYLGPPDHPVFRALAEHVRAKGRDDRPVPFCYWDDLANRSKVEALLQLPAYTLDTFPVRGRNDLLTELQRQWRFPSAERPHEQLRLQHWLGSYGPDVAGTRRPYVVEPLGCVTAVERWLAGGPGRLEPFGYAVTFSPRRREVRRGAGAASTTAPPPTWSAAPPEPSAASRPGTWWWSPSPPPASTARPSTA